MVSRNNNEICLDKVFKKVKDKQFDYIEEKKREICSSCRSVSNYRVQS